MEITIAELLGFSHLFLTMDVLNRIMQITSAAFSDGATIPLKHTGDGENVNPQLSFHDIPQETKSLVLVVSDSNATPEPWIHWFLFNIPPTTTEIPEDALPEGGTEGYANGATHGYEGPNQQYFSGEHTYLFTLYALDTLLDVPNTSTWKEVQQTVQQHTITSAALAGKQTGSIK